MWLCALGGLTAPLSRALPTNHVPWLQWLVELAAHWQWVYATLGAVAMGLAAGAMIFVVSHEVIPETHRNGHETPATLGLMLGFGVMMFLDTALG